MQLHAVVEDMTSQLREQEGIVQQKADDHSQLLEQFQALNVEFIVTPKSKKTQNSPLNQLKTI